MFNKKEFDKYIAGLNSYKNEFANDDIKDRIEKNISDVKNYFKLNNDMEI